VENFNQHTIIAKLNRYLTSRNRPVSLQSGYCHGIGLLWLYKISVGKAQWFYNIVQRIADCEQDSQFDVIEKDIELFISHIEWLQNSRLYARGINQLDLDKLTELPKEFALSFLFHHSQLDSILLLLLKNNKLISISGPDHTICIYKNENQVYLLNPKYNKIKPKIINDIKEIKLEIIIALFNRNYLPKCRLPLEIIVLSNPAALNLRHKNDGYDDLAGLYGQLIDECKEIDEPGLDGITNMHLACESGDQNAVLQLLQHNSNPNQRCKDDLTPLLVSAAKGYTSIVKLLLKFGAIPTFADNNGIKPVDLAREAGHEEIMDVLWEREGGKKGFYCHS
jgi:hypothetical protein